MKKRLHERPYGSLRLRPNSRRRIENLRLQGVACALAELARAHMEPDLAAMTLDSLGLTVADLEAAGADPHDLEPLQKKLRPSIDAVRIVPASPIAGDLDA